MNHARLVLLITSLSCASISTYSLQYQPNAPLDLCTSVQVHANKASIGFATGGWILTTLAASLAVAGSVMGPGTGDDLNWAQKNRHYLVSATGLALSPVVVYMFSRADAASDAASGALIAAQNSGIDAHNGCLQTLADWRGSRKASLASAQEESNRVRAAVDDERGKLQSELLQDAIEELEDEIDTLGEDIALRLAVDSGADIAVQKIQLATAQKRLARLVSRQAAPKTPPAAPEATTPPQ